MNKLLKLFSYGVIASCFCLQVSADNNLLDFIKSCFNTNNTNTNNNVFNNGIWHYNYLNDNNSAVFNAVKEASKSVVSVVATYKSNTINKDDMHDAIRKYFNNNLGESHYNIGSGFCVRIKNNKLYVVTSCNVIKNNKQVSIIFEDNQIVTAKVYNTDKNNNIAVLEVDMYNINRETNVNTNQIQCINWGDSNNANTEETVVAIGNMCGIIPLLSNGILINNNRNLYNNNFIQHTAALNNYYLGGILVNTNGQVIGINTDVSGYVISSNSAKNIIDSIIDNNRNLKGWIGIAVQVLPYSEARSIGIIPNSVVNETKNYKSVGANVLQVIPNGPADKAGIKTNDIIIGVNNNLITDNNTLQELINEYEVGSTVRLTILRRNNYTNKLEELEREISIYNYDNYNTLSIC